MENQLSLSPKRKTSNIVKGILVVFLISAIAGAAYYVSNQLSSRQAVAPTAPESEPQAAAPGKGCCKAGNSCKKTESCNSSCVCKKKDPEPTSLADYKCDSSKCPGPCFSCNASKTSCIAHPNAAGCGGVSETGKPEDVKPPVVEAPPIDPLTGKPANHCGASCDPQDCHCQGGDACTSYKCEPKIKTSCQNQGRSWCVNMKGGGYTCCAAGYTCWDGGDGCIANKDVATTPGTGGGGGPGTPTTVVTQPPVVVPACTEIKFFIATKNAESSCVANTDCAIANQPEGQFCGEGSCHTWTPITLPDLSVQAKQGAMVKFSFTTENTTQVQVKINDGAWTSTTKNTATGRFDYVYTIPNSGTFNIIARYLKP